MSFPLLRVSVSASRDPKLGPGPRTWPCYAFTPCSGCKWVFRPREVLLPPYQSQECLSSSSAVFVSQPWYFIYPQFCRCSINCQKLPIFPCLFLTVIFLVFFCSCCYLSTLKRNLVEGLFKQARERGSENKNITNGEEVEKNFSPGSNIGTIARIALASVVLPIRSWEGIRLNVLSICVIDMKLNVLVPLQPVLGRQKILWGVLCPGTGCTRQAD